MRRGSAVIALTMLLVSACTTEVGDRTRDVGGDLHGSPASEGAGYDLVTAFADCVLGFAGDSSADADRRERAVAAAEACRVHLGELGTPGGEDGSSGDDALEQPQPSPVGVPGEWELIFEDPFDGFDETVWQPRYEWTPIVISNELQAYLPSAVSVEDGVLRLTATDRPAGGQAYTSGVITSYGKFAFRYGAVEFRARAPSGRGLLSALWMLPDSHAYPPELDILEIDGHQPHLAHIAYHWADGDGIASDRSTVDLDDLTLGFHTHTVTWDPGLIVWYVDGVEIHRHAGSEVTSDEMYLLANLAVGGWVGAPDSSTRFPATFELDYVRVWQRR